MVASIISLACGVLAQDFDSRHQLPEARQIRLLAQDEFLEALGNLDNELHGTLHHEPVIYKEPDPKPKPEPEPESIYTTCMRWGCKKEVKRGDVCACGMQN